MSVKAYYQKVIIPTYETGEKEKNPLFLEKRVYQGSCGSVYPHPVIERISDTKTDKEWYACFLENDFLKIMILPELGGRVQMAYDKIKNRHFIYYNEVIKPALVGLTGPWISGGIEFNWPQHHRPSTFDPVDHCIEENDDGSKTIWCSEIERMFRTKGMAGYTLYPDKAYMEVKVKLYNRTSQPQTFLWWANPAVHVNDEYQSIFPPDVHAVFDHGKRDVSKFPIATGTYYKVDYSEGVDISMYKNIPVPTSYMAIHSKYDFVGGYENDTKGGILHIANHHVSPGKKQWTWGHGDFGIAWDRNLTDHNGPYIELMCGVYTDNQPDFSWIMPYEEKSFSQFFMPYHDLGVVKNANKNAMLNLEFDKNFISIKLLATGIYQNAHIILKADEVTIMDEVSNINPFKVYENKIKKIADLPGHKYHISVFDNNENLIIEWSPEKEQIEPVPDKAKAAKEPKDIETIEDLFLNGLHLEQYRHATYDPTSYYLEAISRNPNDIRSNNAFGMWLLKRGKFKDAEYHFQTAAETLTSRNPNSYDGEPFFNLGLSLRLQGKDNEAYKYFYKSVWNAAWMDPGYFQLAQIDTLRKNWSMALENCTRSLLRNWHNHKARHLKTAILRKIKKNKEALNFINESLQIDPFNFGMLYEKYLLDDKTALKELKKLIRANIHNYIEIALDYMWAGLYEEAIAVLDIGISEQKNVYPMAYYYKAWILSLSGMRSEAVKIVLKAEKCSPDYCFPHQIESVTALLIAMELNPEGAKAPYYLGCFWYNFRQYTEALDSFKRSVKYDKSFPTVLRNLALLYFNKFDQKSKALNYMEMAFRLDRSDSRIFMELHQLYKKMNMSVDMRLKTLLKNQNLIENRDDLYLEMIELFILKKDYNKAYNMIMSRKFHPWEGGEGKVSGAYVKIHIGLAEEAIFEKKFNEALVLLEKAKFYPENLGEGKLPNAQENKINYLLGCVYNKLNEHSMSLKAWSEGSTGISEPVIAWYYNDQQPDTIFYQGMSLKMLGKDKEAFSRFNKLVDYGKKHLFDKVKIDYFAVSLPDMQIWEENLEKRNTIHCYYMMALGYKGKGMKKKSDKYFRQIIEMDTSHFGVLEF